MRWLMGIFLALSVALLGGYIFVKGYPYHKYSQWIAGEGYDHFYEISKYHSNYLKPVPLEEIPAYQEDYVQLWREFPIRNSLVPLPTRHPLFKTVPIVELKSKNSHPQIGMSILNPSNRELSRVYTLPTNLYQDHSQGQEIFKLPFVKNKILSKNLDQVWKDIFSYEIEVKSKSLDEMIYDLYILHLRSKLLPAETLRYGLIKDAKQAMIELASDNQDYMVELVMTQTNGSIYSYVLRTEKQNIESRRLRAKFLGAIGFSPVDEAMGRLLYTEFKQLHFARQVDQEGMLYLFSAWSQNPDNVDLLKEMIFYLERGPGNKGQLRPLYNFAFQKYGKTFTTLHDADDDDNPELALQRKIEIEEKETRKAADAANRAPTPAADLTPDEKMNIYLKKAKEEKPKAQEKSDMTVH